MVTLHECCITSWRRQRVKCDIYHIMAYTIHENISFGSCLIVEQSIKGSLSTVSFYKVQA